MSIVFYKKNNGRLNKNMVETYTDDPDAIEVRMPVETYHKIAKMYEELKEKLQTVKEGAEADLACAELDTEQVRRNLQADYEQKLKDQRQETGESIKAEQKKIEEARDTINQLQRDVEFWKDQYSNLLRIVRERANAERQIKPKKEHHGYLMMSSVQVIDKVQILDPQAPWRTEKLLDTKAVWKTILQTPYSILIPIEAISVTIHDDLMLRVLGEMSVDTWTECENGHYPENDEDCVMYRWMYRTSRAGLWEVEIWTTKPITILEHNLPAKKPPLKKDADRNS